MTLRSPLFRKLLFSGFLLIVVTLAGIDFLLTRYTAGRETEHVEHELEIGGRVLVNDLAEVPRDRLEAWAKQAGALTNERVTVIDSRGVVLADSQHDPETMENHAQRPEIKEALGGQRGAAIRHSPTMDIDFYYLAFPARYRGQTGAVLRLAVPMQQVQKSIGDVRWRILRTSLFAALLALAVAYLFSRALTRRIRKIQAFAEGVAQARFSEPLEPEPDDEIGSLARSLREMSEQLRDMLDRLSVEAALREAILASMVEGVLAVDGELRVTFCNESFARAVGAASPVPERLPLLQLVRDPAFLSLLTRILTTGKPGRERMPLAAAAGRAYEIQAAPLGDTPRRGAIAILHDISELERLERIRKDFVANVSHEFRTPLAAIQGYAETLLDGGLEDAENSRKFLEIIDAQAIRLNSIASDLTALSELESEKAPVPLERISIRDAVEAAVHTVEPEALVRNVRVIASEAGDVYIMGHRFRIEQALVNLMQNAIKFNRPGGEVRVDVRLENGKVRIEVSDTGIGIPSEDLTRIFERFYRVDKARSRDVGGTGLGLSIVKHITEKMNGTASAESELGKGSTFTLLFPAA
jgi:two-component system, OmpR family, phosphate regulon sensor histidine kinase PhoR